MTVTVRTIARCDLCEHREDHWCQALNLSVRRSVDEVVSRCQRADGQLLDAEVVLDCHSFWRLGRGHGDMAS